MRKLRQLVIGAAFISLYACGGPENATVEQFFRSAQSNDQPTLASMSAVAPPGEFDAWTIVEATSRTTEPFALPELQKTLDAAEKEREATLEEGRDYMADNVEALDQILPKLQEDPEYEFRGRLGEVQKEWLDLVERRREKERVYQDAKRAVNAETSLVSKSVVRQVAATDLSGEVSVTKLLMNLKAKDQEGELPYTVTLRKYDLTTKGSDRLETARWIITDIEGANEEARAAVEAYRSAGPMARSEPARERPQPARERAEPAPQESAPAQETVQRSLYRPKELRGLARVQILAPETKIQGNDVVSTVRVRNASKDWITRFTATEYWYDEAGTATRGGSKTHDERFMPGEVIELELRTRKNDSFFQNQFEFSHANGEVDATLVSGFPQSD